MYAMNIGAAVPSMTVNILNAMYIVIPPEELLEQYDGVAQTFFNKRKILLDQTARLTEARDRLLPKLMSGKLEV